MDCLEQYEHSGIDIQIFQDEHGDSPREWDNLGTIAYCSSDYILGDKPMSVEEMQEIAEDDSYLCLPVYAYIHGGVTISTGAFSCPWDSGQCGIIYVAKDDEQVKQYQKTEGVIDSHLQAIKCLENEIKTYDQYFTGDVYGYIVAEDQEHESCWGFYGMEDVKAEAESIADWIVEDRRKKREEKTKTFIQNHVPLYARG